MPRCICEARLAFHVECCHSLPAGLCGYGRRQDVAFVRHVGGLPGCFCPWSSPSREDVVLQGCVCRSVLCELLLSGGFFFLCRVLVEGPMVLYLSAYMYACDEDYIERVKLLAVQKVDPMPCTEAMELMTKGCLVKIGLKKNDIMVGILLCRSRQLLLIAVTSHLPSSAHTEQSCWSGVQSRYGTARSFVFR